jgi:hypothetical protein
MYTAPYMIYCKIFFRNSPPAVVANARANSRKLGKQSVLPKKEIRLKSNNLKQPVVWPALADSRKLGKQSILLKKEIRLLTNLGF